MRAFIVYNECPQPCPPSYQTSSSSPSWFPFKGSMTTFTWVSLSDLNFSKKMTFRRGGEVSGQGAEPPGRQLQVPALLTHKVVAVDEHQALVVVLVMARHILIKRSLWQIISYAIAGIKGRHSQFKKWCKVHRIRILRTERNRNDLRPSRVNISAQCTVYLQCAKQLKMQITFTNPSFNAIEYWPTSMQSTISLILLQE